MTHITKHHSEKERESHNSDRSRIGFLISRNTIRVNDLLEAVQEVSCLEVCRSLDIVVVVSRNLGR